MPTRTAPTIRPATLDDAALIADLHVRSWRGSYRDFLPADYLEALDARRHADDYWRPALARATEGSATWVADIDGGGVGFVAIEGPQGIPPPEEALPGCGYVHHIHVVPEFLGRGVGAALWRTGLEALRAAGYHEATLSVYEPNHRARSF
jgi:ribosomal protein S18 acetylase RimI-like enzyme